jgi:hypothetical protein
MSLKVFFTVIASFVSIILSCSPARSQVFQTPYFVHDSRDTMKFEQINSIPLNHFYVTYNYVKSDGLIGIGCTLWKDKSFHPALSNIVTTIYLNLIEKNTRVIITGITAISKTDYESLIESYETKSK